MKFIKYIAAFILLISIASCASSKAVISNTANINKYKYVIIGDDSEGDRELDDIMMTIYNYITSTRLEVISPDDKLKISQNAGCILSPNIQVTTEKWNYGQTYITITFYDYTTDQSVAVVKSSGIGLTVSHDQHIALKAIKKKLDKLF